jgi:serine/threonine protein kinase/dienelactone hydrolase
MIGQTVSHYKIFEKLGEGGMGVVYRAVDTQLDRPVAIKFLRPEAVGSTERRQRFIREARAASALNHPHIITIHDIGKHTEKGVEHDFIVMELVEGKSLGEIIDDKPLPADDMLRYALQVAEAMSQAHDAGIVHRDIKPANVMITEKDQVKIVDFGLAKLVEREEVDESAPTLSKGLQTDEGVALGTAAYMSPEQAEGKPVDVRSDVFSFGAVLYEMLTGRRPFQGDSVVSLRMAILHDEPPPMKSVGGAADPELERIVLRCLEKRKEARYISAKELLAELESYQRSLTSVSGRLKALLRQPRVAVPVAIGVIAIVAAVTWFLNRQADIRWAREEALPELERMVETSWRDFTDAYRLAEEVEKYIPDDPKLSELMSQCAVNISIETEPPGAEIFMKEYGAPDSKWDYLGVSPLEDTRLPVGIFRWKMEKEGYETVLAAASTWGTNTRSRLRTGKNIIVPSSLTRVLDEKGSLPPGMVRVAGAETSVGQLDDFYIDKYEVTNKEYKEFIDNGGYRAKEYWKHEFVKDGRTLTFEEAMAELVDQTGRPGPSTWQAGDYPAGQDDYPVTGVSWYEAAAYAESVGKSLPTGHHWGMARGEYTPMVRVFQLGGYAIFAPFSNFGGEGPAPVGSYPGWTPYGVFDMAGNVREWCWNESQIGRLIRGGAWDDNTYFFRRLSHAPPFDRSAKNGFRCALYADADRVPESAFEEMATRETRDYYKEKPVSDSIFQVYKEQFSYDESDLNAQVESRDEGSEYWIQEKITFDAAYGNERVIAHLFLPKNTSPPYQTVIYFPGSAALRQESSDDLDRYYEFRIFLSFIVKNGRAVLFPVYEGTFERGDPDYFWPIHAGRDSHQFSEYLIQLVKDFKRCIDYLETRQDIDSSKLAFYGMSWGGWLGAVIPAVEERLEANVMLAGSLTGRATRPEADPLNYITRVRTPTLMLNGRYDTGFPYETSIKPAFDLLGTPDEHKELKLYDTDHLPPMVDFITEILAWLDRYLGRVQ